MNKRNTRRGFTLIELLVVVLIIGILAAVALPQYRMAVDKARLSNLITMANTIQKAEEAYYLANGTYTTDFEKLDISFDGTLDKPANNKLFSSEGWTLRAGPTSLVAKHNLLPGNELLFNYAHRSDGWEGRWCYAVRTDERANKLCQNVTGTTARNSVNNNNGDPAYNYRFTNY